MNGIHDLGGMHGFGPVVPEPDEPVFHERWEGRVFGMAAMLLPHRLWTIDAFRYAIETLAPLEYLRSSYYERWLRSLEKLLARAGALDADALEQRTRELASGRRPEPPRTRPGSAPALELPTFLREVEAPPRFAVGDWVRARNRHPAGHTRLPRYVRGRRGKVVRRHAACVFPDTHAHGLGEHPQYVYAVRFEGHELWGEDAEPGTAIHLDLFESYLEPA